MPEDMVSTSQLDASFEASTILSVPENHSARRDYPQAKEAVPPASRATYKRTGSSSPY